MNILPRKRIGLQPIQDGQTHQSPWPVDLQRRSAFCLLCAAPSIGEVRKVAWLEEEGEIISWYSLILAIWGPDLLVCIFWDVSPYVTFYGLIYFSLLRSLASTGKVVKILGRIPFGTPKTRLHASKEFFEFLGEKLLEFSRNSTSRLLLASSRPCASCQRLGLGTGKCKRLVCLFEKYIIPILSY